MARLWGDFLHSYVSPLLTSLQAQDFDCVEFALVVYYTRSSYRYDSFLSRLACLVSLMQAPYIHAFVHDDNDECSCLVQSLPSRAV